MDNKNENYNQTFNQPTEIQKYIRDNTILPCFLKADSNGNLIANKSGFQSIPLDKFHFTKEEDSKFETFETELTSSTISLISIDAFTDISVFHCDSTFTKKAKNKNNYYKTRKFLVGKFILYSINIDPDDIHFTDFIINEIKNVSNTVKNDYQNGKELDNIFKEYGFYIPLTVYIGGIFSTNDQDTIFIKNGNNKTDFNLAFDLIQKLVGKGNYQSSDETHINELFKTHCLNIKGGDIHSTNYKDWKASINISNSTVIGYDNLKNIKYFIPHELSSKLYKSLQWIEEKYEKRKNYCDVIDELKSNNDFIKTGKTSISRGICQVKENPHIYLETFEAKGDGLFFRKRTDAVTRSFADIIVGYHINSCWNDGTNGEWTISQNPLLQKSCDIKFTSQIFRGQRFDVKIYLMKYPD